jgi:CheY-like chemotaxis protein
MDFAQSGDGALQRREAAGESLILIQSDINMPGMSSIPPTRRRTRNALEKLIVGGRCDNPPGLRLSWLALYVERSDQNEWWAAI